jgi:hypothetical protein
MKYVNYTNLDSHYLRAYQSGDRLVRGHQGEVDGSAGLSMVATAERLFTIHNRDDRPDGQLCPSMSVGDVIAFGEIAFSVDACGFKRVDLDHRDLITDRSWREAVR